MSVLPSPQSNHKFYQADGVTPAAAYKVYTYAAGTTTPLATFSDAAGGAANTNPIALNSNGEASIYVTAGVSYDLVLKTPDGTTQVGPTQRVIADGDGALRADLASTLTGEGAALLGWPTGYAINQLGTGQHFGQNGAAIHRLNDRLFLQAATANDGLFPNVAQDWMSAYWVAGGFGTGPMASSIFGVANNANPNAAIGVMSAVRTLDFTSAGTTAIPIFGCAFNNNATLATKVYGGYFEAHRTVAGPSDTIGLEVDTRSMNATITPDPYTFGDVVALQLASGAEWNASGQFDASCAITIAGNPKQFKKGIVIREDALTDLGGGLREPLAIPKSSLIRAWLAANTPGSYIYFATTTAAGSASLQMADAAFKVTETSTGSEQFRVTVTTAAVNYLNAQSSTAGNALQLSASGSDTDIDLQLTPKGAGNVRFGTHVGSGDVACNGYITIKDAGGTTRKLMTTA